CAHLTAPTRACPNSPGLGGELGHRRHRRKHCCSAEITGDELRLPLRALVDKFETTGNSCSVHPRGTISLDLKLTLTCRKITATRENGPMTTDTDLKQLRVAITGGTSGLGLALVRILATRGARVAFLARTARAVERIAQETGACGIIGDVGRKED